MDRPADFPLVEVSGAPRERGRQYGEQAAERIRRGIDHYSLQLAASQFEWPDIQEVTKQFEPKIARFDPAYLEEMKGIAEGASVDFAAVVLLNARTELLKLANRRQTGPSIADGDECTGLVVLPAAAAAARLIHAHNWDWKTECVHSAVVLKIKGAGGSPDILTFTEAGVLARFGFNSVGICITGNYLECDRDYRRLGVPLALIRRKALEQTLLGRAMHAVYTTPKSASNNIIVSHANGVAIDFECVPDETFLVHPHDGLIVHANHFQSPVALAKLLDTGIANMPDSLYRDIRVRDLLAPHVGRITTDHVKAALFDDFETPWSVCRPPRTNVHGNNQSATVAMLVMEPELGWMEAAPLPALFQSFTSYTLDVAVTRPSRTAHGGLHRSAA